LSGAIAKPVSINLRKLVPSPTGSINLGFILRETCCCAHHPFSWGSQLGAYYAPSSIFLAPLLGRKRISARGVSRFQSFTLLLFCLLSLLYFSLHLFIENTNKMVSFIVGISLLLLLVHYVVP
jgi:hypothetical protein